MSPPDGPPMTLRPVNGSADLAPLALDRERTTIGRSPRATMTLDDPFASRLHAELRREGDSWWVSDLGSSNGTFLNDNRVSGPVQAFAGDHIRVGETELALEPLGAEGGPTAPDTGDLDAVLESVARAGGATEPAAPDRDLFKVISKVGVALLSSTSLDAVLTRILELIFDGIPADRAALFLRTGDETRLRAASFRDATRRVSLDEVKVSRTVEQQVLEAGDSVLATDAQMDERYRELDSVRLSGVRSIMAVPMKVGDRVIGMIYVDSPLEVRPFGRQDLQLLTTIASVAAIKVQNALLLEEQIETQRMRDELRKARDLQIRLLPSTPPTVPGYQLAGVSFPCYEVGGDYFDFVPGREGHVLVTLGDVSGKGLDAALLMSSLHACVRSQLGRVPGVGDLVDGINEYLCAAFPYNKFATLVCGDLDPATHRLTYVNAGHNPPLLVRASGEVIELAATGLPAGLAAEERYLPKSIDLGPGDLVFAYSDGISEAEGPDGEMLEAEGLGRLLVELRGLTAGKLVDRLDDLLAERSAGDPEDDMTMVVLKRDG